MMPNKSSNNYDETVSYVEFQKILTETESHSFHFSPRFSPLKLNMKNEEKIKSNNK
jgi:Tat protein secretion system quality control protein TatD with DNase activity